MAKLKINLEVDNLEKAIKLLKEYKELLKECIALKEEFIHPTESDTHTVTVIPSSWTYSSTKYGEIS